jgi:hypothetical protein
MVSTPIGIESTRLILTVKGKIIRNITKAIDMYIIFFLKELFCMLSQKKDAKKMYSKRVKRL